VAAATATNEVFANLRNPPANAAAPGARLCRTLCGHGAHCLRARTLSWSCSKRRPFPTTARCPARSSHFLMSMMLAGVSIARRAAKFTGRTKPSNEPRVLLHIPG